MLEPINDDSNHQAINTGKTVFRLLLRYSRSFWSLKSVYGRFAYCIFIPYYFHNTSTRCHTLICFIHDVLNGVIQNVFLLLFVIIKNVIIDSKYIPVKADFASRSFQCWLFRPPAPWSVYLTNIIIYNPFLYHSLYNCTRYHCYCFMCFIVMYIIWFILDESEYSLTVSGHQSTFSKQPGRIILPNLWWIIVPARSIIDSALWVWSADSARNPKWCRACTA